MSVVVTILSNNETAHPSTLLKTEFTTDILIGKVDKFQKFQNSCFKEHLRKVVAAEAKSMYFKSIHATAHGSTECNDLCFQFTKFLGVLHFLRRSMYRALNERATD